MSERWKRRTFYEQFNDLLRSEIGSSFSRHVRTIATGDCPHMSVSLGRLCPHICIPGREALHVGTRHIAPTARDVRLRAGGNPQPSHER